METRAVRLFVVVAIVALVAGAWSLSTLPGAAGGTPRLVLDRDSVDLGDLPFETRARVAFTLTNAGDGALEIIDTPRVKAVEGC